MSEAHKTQSGLRVHGDTHQRIAWTQLEDALTLQPYSLLPPTLSPRRMDCTAKT